MVEKDRAVVVGERMELVLGRCSYKGESRRSCSGLECPRVTRHISRACERCGQWEMQQSRQ